MNPQNSKYGTYRVVIFCGLLYFVNFTRNFKNPLFEEKKTRILFRLDDVWDVFSRILYKTLESVLLEGVWMDDC